MMQKQDILGERVRKLTCELKHPDVTLVYFVCSLL